VTISKNELAEIARSGYPETADEDPRCAAEAVGLFNSDTIAVSTALAETVLQRSVAPSHRRCGATLTPSQGRDGVTLRSGSRRCTGSTADRGPAGWGHHPTPALTRNPSSVRALLMVGVHPKFIEPTQTEPATPGPAWPPQGMP
jgi:hypothetical protein